MPSRPRPSTQRETPGWWCTTWLQLWSTCTAPASSTETSNQRTCWYTFTLTLVSYIRIQLFCGFQLSMVFFVGVWVSRWHQVTETGGLWPGHGGGRTFIHCVWNAYICGSRNHLGVRVRYIFGRRMLWGAFSTYCRFVHQGWCLLKSDMYVCTRLIQVHGTDVSIHTKSGIGFSCVVIIHRGLEGEWYIVHIRLLWYKYFHNIAVHWQLCVFQLSKGWFFLKVVSCTISDLLHLSSTGIINMVCLSCRSSLHAVMVWRWISGLQVSSPTSSCVASLHLEGT